MPPAAKQDNVNFVSRSTRLNTEFTAETVAGALRNIRDRQEFIAKEYYDQHYQPGNPQHDSPPVPDEKLRQWRLELEDLKRKTRPFLTATDALRDLRSPFKALMALSEDILWSPSKALLT